MMRRRLRTNCRCVVPLGRLSATWRQSTLDNPPSRTHRENQHQFPVPERLWRQLRGCGRRADRIQSRAVLLADTLHDSRGLALVDRAWEDWLAASTSAEPRCIAGYWQR